MRRRSARRTLVQRTAVEIDDAIAFPLKIAVEARMKKRDMVPFLIIVDIVLPVAGDLKFHVAVKFNLGRRRFRDGRCKRTEPILKLRSRQVQIHEDQTTPCVDAYRKKRQFVLWKVARLAKKRCVFQAALGIVAPTVIGTGEPIARPGSRGQKFRRPVAANIMKAVQRAVLSAQYEDRKTGWRRGQILTRLRDHLFASYTQPVAGKYVVPFLGIDLRVPIPTRGHRPNGCGLKTAGNFVRSCAALNFTMIHFISPRGAWMLSQIRFLARLIMCLTPLLSRRSVAPTANFIWPTLGTKPATGRYPGHARRFGDRPQQGAIRTTGRFEIPLLHYSLRPRPTGRRVLRGGAAKIF